MDDDCSSGIKKRSSGFRNVLRKIWRKTHVNIPDYREFDIELSYCNYITPYNPLKNRNKSNWRSLRREIIKRCGLCSNDPKPAPDLVEFPERCIQPKREKLSTATFFQIVQRGFRGTVIETRRPFALLAPPQA